MADVTIFDFVLFALGTEPAVFLGCRQLAARFHELVVSDGFGANEAFLEIGVDLTCSLRRQCAALDRPCSRLIFTCRDEGNQIEEAVG